MVCALSGDRLSMVRIGTTNVSPEVLAPTASNIKLCGCHDNPVDEGATETFQCEETGRYLVVLLEKEEGRLSLCEVQVFEGTVSARWYTEYPCKHVCVIFLC